MFGDFCWAIHLQRSHVAGVAGAGRPALAAGAPQEGGGDQARGVSGQASGLQGDAGSTAKVMASHGLFGA